MLDMKPCLFREKTFFPLGMLTSVSAALNAIDTRLERLTLA